MPLQSVNRSPGCPCCVPCPRPLSWRHRSNAQSFGQGNYPLEGPEDRTLDGETAGSVAGQLGSPRSHFSRPTCRADDVVWPGRRARWDFHRCLPSLSSISCPGRVSTTPIRRKSPSKTSLCLTLELAHPLTGDAELRAQLGQGRWLPLVQPVAAYQDMPLTGRHLSHRLLELGVLHLPDHRLWHLRGLLVLDELP